MSRIMIESVLALWIVSGLPTNTIAASIYWEDGDGSSNTIVNAGWNDVQTAITSAVNGVDTRGAVKLSGDFHRNLTDTTVPGLIIPATGGSLTLSGGWGTNFVAQQWKAIWNSTHDIVQEREYYSTLDVNGNDSYRYRVLDVQRNESWVEGLRITRGCATDNTIPGGGIRVKGHDVRLSHLDVDGNACHTHGGGVYIGGDYGLSGYGQRAAIDYSTIRNNSQGYHGGWGGGVGVAGSDGLIANSIFIGNDGWVTSDGGWDKGSAIGVVGGCKTKVFGCLFEGQVGVRSAIGSGAKGVDFTMANCTVAGNSNSGYRTGSLDFTPDLEIRNSIFATNGVYGVHLENSNAGGTNMLGGYSGFLGGLLLYGNVSGDIVTNTENYVDEGGIQIGTDPQFVGGGSHPYRLRGSSPAVNAGIQLRTMSSAEVETGFGAAAVGRTIRYVNMDVVTRPGDVVTWSASYDAKTDIVVDLGGYAPTEQHYLDHFIYPHDLAGNRRVRLAGIDIGAYEFQPAKGTVVLMK